MGAGVIIAKEYGAKNYESMRRAIHTDVLPQSVGDSRHPLYYLIASSIVNVVLDLVLVGGFRLGVGAAALATTVSQGISAALCFVQLLRSKANWMHNFEKIEA